MIMETSLVHSISRRYSTIIYTARVDLDDAENTDVVPFNGIYKYTAKLFYKQFSRIVDSTNYEKDTVQDQFKASSSVTLLTDFALTSINGAQTNIVVLPCVNMGEHYEAIVAQQSYTTPWKILFNGDTATCESCIYARGPLTIDGGNKTIALGDVEDTDTYISGYVNLNDGTVSLAKGGTIASVTDQTPATDDATVKILLYRVIKYTDADSWTVLTDYRSIPQLGVRI